MAAREDGEGSTQLGRNVLLSDHEPTVRVSEQNGDPRSRQLSGERRAFHQPVNTRDQIPSFRVLGPQLAKGRARLHAPLKSNQTRAEAKADISTERVLGGELYERLLVEPDRLPQIAVDPLGEACPLDQLDAIGSSHGLPEGTSTGPAPKERHKDDDRGSHPRVKARGAA
jgi:hypothetical protein